MSAMHIHHIRRQGRYRRLRLLLLRVGVEVTHQFSLCVSFAIVNSFPSFSMHLSAARPCIMSGREHLFNALINSPKSLILYTPAALELALRCPLTAPLSSGGEDDKPDTAESTLLRGTIVSADMLTWSLVFERRVQKLVFTKFEGLGVSDLNDG